MPALVTHSNGNDVEAELSQFPRRTVSSTPDPLDDLRASTRRVDLAAVAGSLPIVPERQSHVLGIQVVY